MWLDVLKKMKKDSGKTAKEISEMTGIPKSTIDKLFSGQTKEPYLSMVRSIVYSLGYTLDDLDDTQKSTAPAETGKDDANKQKLMNNYDLLNNEGQQDLVDYSDMLAGNPRKLKESDKAVPVEA